MRKIKKQKEKRDRFVQYMQKLLYSNIKKIDIQLYSMCQDVMISKVQSTKSTLSYNFLVVHVHSGILSLLQCLYTYFTIAFS